MGNYMGAAKKDKKVTKNKSKTTKVTNKNKRKRRTPKKISY